MDGILVLALIGWLISQMSKKNKKPKAKAGRAVNAEQAARRRAERIAQLQAEAEKRRVKTMPKETEPPAAIEGQSFVPPVVEEAFRGSMQVESTEGECLCEPELEHVREEKVIPESVYAGEIGREKFVDFSAKGMMQGVVMSEILTRPAQRMRRR